MPYTLPHRPYIYCRFIYCSYSLQLCIYTYNYNRLQVDEEEILQEEEKAEGGGEFKSKPLLKVTHLAAEFHPDAEPAAHCNVAIYLVCRRAEPKE